MPVATVMDWDSLPAVLTIEHCALILRCGRKKMLAIAHSPGFPLMQHGKLMRVSKHALQRWVEQRGAGEDPAREMARRQWR